MKSLMPIPLLKLIILILIVLIIIVVGVMVTRPEQPALLQVSTATSLTPINTIEIIPTLAKTSSLTITTVKPVLVEMTSIPEANTVLSQSPTPDASITPTQTLIPSPKPTQTKIPTPTSTQTLLPSPTPTLSPDSWMSFPVNPVVSDNARAIYKKGQGLGNHPYSFSKVGDCNSMAPNFLSHFDGSPEGYNLGANTYLEAAIKQFAGSFKRQGYALGDGFNTSAVLAPFRADPNNCGSKESPLACEYRIQKPAFAIIAIGKDDYVRPEVFEANFRKIIVTTIDLGIVPILATMMDTVHDPIYNQIIAKLAYEYDIPLWNYWLAVQPLPNYGLDDNIHPNGSFAAFDFSNENLARYGWPVRNLTALQALYTTWQVVTQP
jgi:hypothetical protein